MSEADAYRDWYAVVWENALKGLEAAQRPLVSPEQREATLTADTERSES